MDILVGTWRFWIVILSLSLASCASLTESIPKAGISGLGAGVGSLFGGAPGAMIGGSLSSFGADAVLSTPPPVTGFWSLLGRLIEIGGWALLLVVIIPWILGWFTPIPRRKK